MTQDPTTLTTTPKDDVQRLAHAVREACIRAAVDGYEQGGISELCAEGRFELAIDALRSLNLDSVRVAVKTSRWRQEISVRR
ncbi:MAG: hypothetical protein ACYDH4_11070 [Candidatus Cryosericum sp.]